MDELTEQLLTLVIGGILGGLIKSLLDYRSQVFSQLWTKRVTAYEELWRIMKQFPLWPRLKDVKYCNLHEMSEKMRSWYFDTGGILMSKKTRILYGKLQKVINDEILNPMNFDKSNRYVTDDEYDRIQKLCSRVRSQMTNDLLSRKNFL